VSPAAPIRPMSLQAFIAAMTVQIQQLGQHRRAHIQGHAELNHQEALLTSIPGMGAVTIVCLLAAMAHLRRRKLTGGSAWSLDSSRTWMRCLKGAA
jgi:hypothetical protein